MGVGGEEKYMKKQVLVLLLYKYHRVRTIKLSIFNLTPQLPEKSKVPHYVAICGMNLITPHLTSPPSTLSLPLSIEMPQQSSAVHLPVSIPLTRPQ